jgi:anti-sigma-K factor RskA
MTCEELKDSFEFYALGLLEGDERAELDAHIHRGCQTCRQSLNDAMAVNALVLSLSPEVAPPSRLKRRLMASVGVERRGWGWAAGLAAACMLVVALWLSVQERQRAGELADARRALLQASADRDRMQQALNFLNDPETRPVSFGKSRAAPPRGNVFLNPRSGVLLIASNLPSLIAGRIYEMWMIPKAGAPRPAGLFQANAAGTAFHVLSGPLDAGEMSAVAVTVEPESGSPAPTTTPIIVAPVAGL